MKWAASTAIIVFSLTTWFVDQPARAHGIIDTSKLRCPALLELRRDYTLIVVSWLRAYNRGKDVHPIIDVGKILEDTLALSHYCEKNPDRNISDAIEVLYPK